MSEPPGRTGKAPSPKSAAASGRRVKCLASAMYWAGRGMQAMPTNTGSRSAMWLATTSTPPSRGIRRRPATRKRAKGSRVRLKTSRANSQIGTHTPPRGGAQ